MKWYLKVLKQYDDFGGRARREEYWMFVVINAIFLVSTVILDNILGTVFGELNYGLFYFLYIIAMLIPHLAVAVRRLHDIGKSGWMILILLIPIIGEIWLLVLFIRNSEQGENKYGPNPKEIAK